jgi:hypothetical protein
MDAALAPVILLALLAGIVGTALELRAAAVPPACPECPHCRAAQVDREREAEERRQKQQDLQNWYARRNRIDTDEDERRLD